MGSRIFWVLIAGVALVTGMVVQGDGPFSWDDEDGVSERVERRVEGRVDREIDRSVRQVPVIDARGREVGLSDESKRALAEAVGRLVETEADYAVLRVRDARPEALAAAKTARDHARAEVDRLKTDIKAHEAAARGERDATREQIRNDIRETVRDVVGN